MSKESQNTFNYPRNARELSPAEAGIGKIDINRLYPQGCDVHRLSPGYKR